MEKINKFDILIFLLSIYTLIELYISTIFDFNPNIIQILYQVDFIICILFLYDFFNRFYKSQNKIKFLKYNFIDFISSIPTIGYLRMGRIFRIFKILRIIRSGKVFYKFLNKYNSKSTFVSISVMILILMTCAGVGIHVLEKDLNTGFNTFENSMWWTFITTFTLGLAQDISPLTIEGRIFTAALIIMGFVLISLFTAVITDHFVDDEGINKKLSRIEKDIQEIKDIINKL